MKIQSIGHVVLKVTDLERSEQFYSGLLGMKPVARYDDKGYKMTFFSVRNHHDLAVLEVSGEDAAGGDQAVGMHHVAFCIGDSIDQLREAKEDLESARVECRPSDHDVTKSLYFEDPDGNMIELYVDVSDGWRTDPSRIATVEALEL
jgi:catechol 2,3-dioxygenase